MIDYFLKRPERIIEPLMQHLQLCALALAISLVFASLLCVASLRWPKLGRGLQAFFSALYAIPSLALFALLIPFTGLGRTTALVVLVLYNQYVLLRSFLAGFAQIDPAILEAARGIGMTFWERLIHVQLPLATPSLFAGMRLATVSTVGIATIAAFINAGGLGTLLSEGTRSMNLNKILWGSVLSAGLALVLDGFFRLVEKLVSKRGGGSYAAGS